MSTEQVVEIPRIERTEFTVTIEGLSPLLSNRFSDEAKGQILAKQMKKATTAKKAKDPEQDFQQAIYRTRDGKPAFPASAVKKACVNACRFLDMKMTEARGAFYIMGDADNLLPIEGEPEMHESVVRLQGRTADIRFRAIYPEWRISFRVLYNPRILSMEAIINQIEHAGFHIGIGDWRPEKDGTFGMFRVVRQENS